MPTEHTQTATVPNVARAEAYRVWARVAALSFGGPAGQIAVMHRLVVDEKKWVSEDRFLHALNYTMLLPGPEAQQLVTYLGWLLHGITGGLFAGTLFILPGFVSILALSILYAGFQELTAVQALFYGLKPAVLAVVIEAVVRIGRRALRHRVTVAIALTAFLAIFFFNIPFPLIIVASGTLGYLGGRLAPQAFGLMPSATGTAAVAPPVARPSLRRAAVIAAIGAAIWFLPLVALLPTVGRDNVFTQITIFFSQTAVVTFGGAYAVLAYIAQQAVDVFGWLQPGEMLDGLGMAETTPGPLVQVVQFVGFMGAYRNPGAFTALQAGIIGAVLTTWATFVPCFIWIFVGAPFIEFWRRNRALSSALTGITAAVVGVILNLAVWFGLQTVFGTVTETYVGPLRLFVPDAATVDPFAALIAAAAFVALFRFKSGMIWTLAGSALAGTIAFYRGWAG